MKELPGWQLFISNQSSLNLILKVWNRGQAGFGPGEAALRPVVAGGGTCLGRHGGNHQQQPADLCPRLHGGLAGGSQTTGG